ncbi:hypothetical protein [Hahella sp. HN01]|uniref:hypothetical protein n=1 Tax=Hahella sp. HN01 TaxID=2847262 RepID=UPI001C1E9F81|nr:hypothetical protein [Hahella sp. HN01]MBU6955722.1 hypothetical protein [Hahella sp. HN01]
MTPKAYFGIALITATLGLSTWLLGGSSSPSPSDTNTSTSPEATVAVNDANAFLPIGMQNFSAQARPSSLSKDQDSLLEDQALERYAEYQSYFDYGRDYRELLQHAEQMDSATRREKFSHAEQNIDRLEKEHKLSAAEGLIMKLALLKITPNDPEAKAKGIELIQQYKQAGEARMQEFKDNPDPRFAEYKKREAEIVKEVLAMTHYPNGLSRDDYLAQRLNEELKQAYALDSSGATN